MKLKKSLHLLQVILIIAITVSCSETTREEPDNLGGPTNFPLTWATNVNVYWSTTDTVISLDSYYRDNVIVQEECEISQSGIFSIDNGKYERTIITGKNETVDWANCTLNEDKRELQVYFQPNNGPDNRYFKAEVTAVPKEGRKILIIFTFDQPCE